LAHGPRAHAARAVARLDAGLAVRARLTVTTAIDAGLVPVALVTAAALAEAGPLEALFARAVLGYGAGLAVTARLAIACAVDARLTLFEVENPVVAVRFVVDEAVFGNLASRENGRDERSES
jgi:hypothetical protein